jgi:hypothetical protein
VVIGSGRADQIIPAATRCGMADLDTFSCCLSQSRRQDLVSQFMLDGTGWTTVVAAYS